MPKYTPPVPLNDFESAQYDDLYNLFGKDEANKYAFDITSSPVPGAAQARPAPVVAAPATEATPSSPGSPSVMLPAAAYVTPKAVPPIGMQPPSAPIPATREKLINRPGIDELRVKNEAAQVKRIDELTTLYKLSGMKYEDAQARARDEVIKGIEQPRTVEFASKPVRPGTASDFATRGVELAPRLDTARTVIEAFKPQVLESEQQAAGRKRFQADQQRADAMLRAEAAKSGLSVTDVANRMALANSQRALDIARQMYGDAATVAQIKQVEDTLNAPIYAASTELTKGVFAPLTEIPGKVLRGLTETEIRGQRVESQGAAALRDIGGISRVALGGIKAGVMDPLSKAAIAADEGISIQEVDARLQRDRAQQGGASQTVSVNPLGAPVAVGPRSRIDTGDWLKDTAYEIATGRSAVDDYIDLGVSPNAAVVAGVMTEFMLPVSPIGWITDVAPAFGAAKAVAKAGQIAGDAAKAPALYQFFADTARSAADVGLVLEKPTFWQTLTRAADVRTKVATDLAGELSNVATFDKLAAEAAVIGVGNKAKTQLVDFVDDLLSMPRRNLTPTVARIGDELLASGADLTKADEIVPVLQKILRGDAQNPGIVTKIKTVAPGNVQADIVRNTYAAAIKNPAISGGGGDGGEAVVRAAIAETLEKVPDNGWAFMTPSLIIKKTVMTDKAFQTAVSDAVKALPPGASLTDVQKAVETSAKDFLKGKGSVAEPIAMTPGRPETLLPSAPRGGLERLAIPESRRAAVIEAAQDVGASVKGAVAAVDDFLRGGANPNKRVSDTFAGSTFVSGLDNTLTSALNTRMPSATRTMIDKTRSEMTALGMIKTVSFPGQGGGTVGTSSGTLINAIRTQGGLDSYVTARIASDIGDGKLKASTHSAPVTNVPLRTLPQKPTTEKIEGIVQNFFGEGDEGIEFITSEDVMTRLGKIVEEETANADTAAEAVAQSIKRLRDEYPALNKVGRRSPGTVTDDVSGAMLNYVINSECKKIYVDNFFETYPELVEAVSPNSIRNRFINEMNAFGGQITDAEKLDAIKLWDSKFSTESARTEFAELVNDQLKKDFGTAAVEYEILPYHIIDGPAGSAFFDSWLSHPNGYVTSAMTAATDITDNIMPMLGFATMSKLIRPLDEAAAIKFLSDVVKMPIGSTEYKVIRSILPIDDLTKSSTTISDNLIAIRRNPELSGYVSSAFKGILEQVRGQAIQGLTSGTALPNPKFFALNYFGAIPMMAVTSPQTAAVSLGAEGARLVGLKGVNLHDITAGARDARRANEIALTTTTGVPYTYKQLADFLDNNYFGMTERDFAFSNRFGEDVRIATETAPSGMKSSAAASLKDEVMRYLNINGTSLYGRIANQVDINWRKQTFINALMIGEAPNVAQRTATNAIFDYGRIPKEYRQSLSRYMSFLSFWTMSNAEMFSTLFRPNAMKNVAKTIIIQRDLNRGFGEWDYADDANKQRMYSMYLGQDDEDQPTYFVGPQSPVLAPLIDTARLLPALSSIGVDAVNADFAKVWGKSVEGIATVALEKIFTPVIGYLQDIGAIGDAPKSTIVPWQQINFHQAMGQEHFGEWMRSNGVSALPLEDRRVGVPEFNGQQYQYNDDAAMKRAAGLDLAFSLAGVARTWDDAEKVFGVFAPVQGADMKRYSKNKTAFLLQYALGGNLKKGTPEYEFYYAALKSEGYDLNPK